MLKVLDIVRYNTAPMLEVVEGGLCFLELLEVSEMLKEMRCVLLCVLGLVDGIGCDALRATLYAGDCQMRALFTGSVGCLEELDLNTPCTAFYT